MESSYGQHGWREFLTNRERLLSEYDRLKAASVNRPVRVAHGSGLEASLREWLGEFLPRRYAVTSGYVVPDLYDDTLPLYHYDIIIYDALNAPVLWTEGNADQSAQGKARAIPASYVVALFEVKARLTSENVRDALEKLNQTQRFAAQLHERYSCGVVFGELLETENASTAILKWLLSGKDVVGFSGGMVLRYEGDASVTGLVGLQRREPAKDGAEMVTRDPMHGLPLAKNLESLAVYLTEDGGLELGEQGAGAELVCVEAGRWEVSKSYGRTYFDGDIGVSLTWSRGHFSRFCIELISRLEGLQRRDDKAPSFGRVFDRVPTKRAPAQPTSPAPGMPFLVISLHKAGASGEAVAVESSGGEVKVTYWIAIANTGSVDAEISDDGFRTKAVLPAGAKATKMLSMVAKPKDESEDALGAFDKEAVEVVHRILYRRVGGPTELFSVEARVTMDRRNPRLVMTGA